MNPTYAGVKNILLKNIKNPKNNSKCIEYIQPGQMGHGQEGKKKRNTKQDDMRHCRIRFSILGSRKLELVLKYPLVIDPYN